MDIEAAGAAVTGGLVANAVEKPTGRAGEVHSTCSDCGAETSGNFCANCGQPTHVHRTLLHLGEELLHGVMHFDARIWRTLPLLVINPGRLTREWVQGKRTRYVSPLAMFLFTIFVMFFALSFMPAFQTQVEPIAQQIADQRLSVAAAEQAATEAKAALAEAAGSGAAEGVASGILASSEGAVITQKARLAQLEREAVEGRRDGLTSGSWQAQIADLDMNGTTKIEGSNHTGMTLLKKLKNPDLALYKLQQTMYKFAFLLIPFSIPFVALLFLWKRGFTLYDHGVFVLYSLTFMAMLLMAIVVVARLGSGWAVAAISIGSLAIPVHMFAQLKGAYGLSIFSALWRTFLLLIFSNIVVSLFVAAIIYLGLGH